MIMAIKKLQNNFTTPDQSKRLLKLGVPVDSADMYYKHILLAPYLFSDGVLFSVYSKVEDILPCWSVGRLIEIYELCVGERFERRANPSTLQLLPIMEDIMEQYQMRIESIYRHIDFSKLD